MIYTGMCVIWWSLYVFISYNIVFYMFFIISYWVWGNWEWCEGGGAWLKLPPSRGCPYLVENELFLKPRESHEKKSWLDLKKLAQSWLELVPTHKDKQG